MKESFTEVHGHRLFHVQEGNGGVPILLVHGTPSASFRWRPVQQLISPYLKTHAFDLIGMGKSDKPLRDWDYTFANDALMMVELMDHLGYEKMVICGDDWGGGIALTFASLYPKRTELCISIDPVCYDIWPVPEFPELWSPLITAVPLQLLCYELAGARGLDTEQPLGGRPGGAKFDAVQQVWTRGGR